MAPLGNSGTPLIKKLGIKPQMRILILNRPSDYWKWMETDLSSQLVSAPPAELVHIFAVSKKELDKEFRTLIGKLDIKAIIWISWYKKSAKIPTDITEDSIREIVLPTGWVDIKVCAVSEQWSGLKIVKRKEH
jgi:hypothetical protein